MLEYVCSNCGQIHKQLGQALLEFRHAVWIKHHCPQCGGLAYHVQWSYTLYEDAKRIVGKLYTRNHQEWPACVICGRTSDTWIAHHIVSQRYKLGKCDIRNIIPVCSDRCHTKAHSSKKLAVRETLYWFLGGFDMAKGRDVFNQGRAIWLPKTGANQCHSF